MLITFINVGVISTYAWDTLQATSSSSTIVIGDWRDTFIWEEDTFYQEGDIVLFEGNYYIAIRWFVPKNIEPEGHPASWVFWKPSE